MYRHPINFANAIIGVHTLLVDTRDKAAACINMQNLSDLTIHTSSHTCEYG